MYIPLQLLHLPSSFWLTCHLRVDHSPERRSASGWHKCLSLKSEQGCHSCARAHTFASLRLEQTSTKTSNAKATQILNSTFTTSHSERRIISQTLWIKKQSHHPWAFHTLIRCQKMPSETYYCLKLSGLDSATPNHWFDPPTSTNITSTQLQCPPLKPLNPKEVARQQSLSCPNPINSFESLATKKKNPMTTISDPYSRIRKVMRPCCQTIRTWLY